MSCPYFNEMYVGVCEALEEPYVPTIGELEQFCFREHYRSCPIFEAYILGDKVRQFWSSKSRLSDYVSMSR